MFTRKPRLRLEKFTINGTKRLLQQYRHFSDETISLNLGLLIEVKQT